MNVINTGVSQAPTARTSRDFSLHIPIGLLNDLSAARTRDETLHCFAFWSHRIVQADRCSVSLFADGVLQVMGLSGNGAIPTGTTLQLHDSLPGKVFTERQGQTVFDPENQPFLDTQKLAAAGVTTIMMVPLLANDRCFGTLGFGFQDPVSDCEDRRAIIDALARCLATQLLIVEQINELATLAETDPLTGAYNRRQFLEISKLLWAHWQESETQFAVAAVDLDHFKRVNDENGHDAGDQVLKAIASRMQRCLREGDTLVRMGGEEFFLLLQNCALDQAIEIVTRAHAVVGEKSIQIGATALSVTVSIGVAAVSKADKSVGELCRRADDLLYLAKKQGRDRVVAQRPEQQRGSTSAAPK